MASRKPTPEPKEFIFQSTALPTGGSSCRKKKELKDASGARTININGDHPTYNETNNE